MTTQFVGICTLLSIAIVACVNREASADDPPPGKIRLLPGYKHKRLQGFDSLPGMISKDGGLQIYYDIGAIRKPDQPRLGGQFTDHALAVPEKDRRWFKEQTIDGQPVHLAFTKDDSLRVAYPKSGINFTVDIKSHEHMADALLMILSFRGKAK